MVQGSQIGPLLFISFVNDIVDLVKDPVSCKLFADDVKLYSKIEGPIDNAIDMTLRTIQEWSRKWQMNLNPSKSSTMTIGNDQTTKSYTIDNIEIPRVANIRDLGLVYDNHLKFDDYISSITNRAYQRIGLIFRAFVSNNVTLLKRAYIVYVRPILEYCTCVWSPYLLEDIRKIESVQRYFTRRLFPKNSYSYNERLFLLNLESLEGRRLKYDLKMYFKIMNNLTIINPNDFFLFGNIGVTRGHGFKLQKRLLHNNRLSNIFTNRAVDCWNSLPNEIVNVESYAAFARKIKQLDLSEFLKGMP